MSDMSHLMTVLVNGIPKQIPSGSTIAALLALLGIDRTRVAIERNHDIVPKKTYDEVHLLDGDRLEVVTFVGGG